MTDENIEPVEIGFTEFMVKLIEETFEAILSSQTEQERRINEASRLLSQPIEITSNEIVTHEEVNHELSQLFPINDSTIDYPHAIYQGAQYQLDQETGIENPPIKKLLGITLSGAETRSGELSLSAVRKIEREVRMRLASNHIDLLRTMVSQGIPRVMVQGGRINSKISMKVIDVTDREEQNETKEVAKTYANFPYRFGSFKYPDREKNKPTSNLRIAVRMTDDKSPQSYNVSTNVYGEVEIDFKTVV